MGLSQYNGNVTGDIPKNPFKFGIFASRPHLKWVASAIICVVAATVVGRYSVVILRNLTDSLSAASINFDEVWLWALTWPLMRLLELTLWRGSGFTGMRWFSNYSATAYQSLFEYLSFHSKDYFNSRFAGSLVNKISNAADGTEHVWDKILWRFIPLFISISSYIVITLTTNIKLGAILGFWSLFFLLINTWLAQKVRPYSMKHANAQSVLKGRIVDSLSNISLVHEYAYVSGEHKYIKKFINKRFETGLKNWSVAEWVLVLNGILISMFMFFMIVTSVYLFQIGAVSLGVIIMVIAMMVDLSGQFFSFGQELRDASKHFGQAEEGLEEILHGHLIVDSPDASNLTLENGSIDFEHVFFEYENTRVFKDFSIVIPAGQRVGLIGRSGAGKTTFVSLLLRHFDIREGEIKIDGQNIQKVTLESLRRAIAFVPQDTSLFHRTILENIRYSSPEASIAEVEKAAKLAQAHRFIMALPKGYETLVGERGVKLSGGQRQRVAIARAFLKNAPILVLDEATSSLDSESEQAIQVALDKLIKGRTVIAIAHRLSTLKQMDRLIILDNGKIVEEGPPEELLTKKDGVFKAMWERQVEGFILDE